MELVRYLHFNPVRAAMAANPSDYSWSSHRSYLGKDSLPWLTTSLVLGQFHAELAQARRAYAAFMAGGAGEGSREEFQSGSHEGRILGDDRFIEKVLAQAEGAPCKPIDAERLKEVVQREFGCTMAELAAGSQRQALSRARATMGWLAVQTGAATLTEVGRWVGRDVVTMSASVRRLGERAESLPELRIVLEKLRSEL